MSKWCSLVYTQTQRLKEYSGNDYFPQQKSHLSTGYSHRECILEGARTLNQRPVWRQFPNGFRAYRKPACIVSSVISRIYHSVSHSDRSLRGWAAFYQHVFVFKLDITFKSSDNRLWYFCLEELVCKEGIYFLFKIT